MGPISELFDTSGFPPRWLCGQWSAGLGWMHILSDLATWGAYLAIPLALAFFVLRRRDIPFPRIFWLFAAFIFCCGTVHLIEAIIFWHPVYRLAGVVKLTTAIVSWVTVVAVIRLMPRALLLPGLAQSHARLQADHTVLQAVSRLQSLAIANRPTSELFEEMLAVLREVSGSPIALVSEVCRTGDKPPYLRHLSISTLAAGDPSSKPTGSGSPESPHVENFDRLLDAVLQSGQPVIANDLASETCGDALPPGHPPLRALLGLPVYRGSRLLGIVGLANRAGGYDPQTVELLEPLVAACGCIMEAHRHDLRRRRAEQQHLALGRILENSLNEVYIFDAETWRFLMVNRGGRANLGYSTDELRQLTPLELIPDLAAAAFNELLAPLRSGCRTSVRFTSRFRRKDGTSYPVELLLQTSRYHGRAVFVATALDITRQQDAVATARASEERFRLVVQGTTDGIWDWNIVDGQVYYSPRFKQLLGFADDEVPGNFAFFESRMHPEDRDLLLRAVSDHLKRQVPLDAVCRLQHRSGEYSWFRVRGQATWDEQGRARRMAGSILDVNLTKRIEEELIRAKEAAIAASLSKSEFLANMSHEVRTPLTAILGYTELLLGSGASPQQVEALETIQRNGQHLLGLLNDILDLSKIEAGKLSVESISCAPYELLYDVYDTMRVRSDAKGLILSLVVETDLPDRFHSDPTRLRQILINLVSNAVKFTEVGEVQIRARYVPRDAQSGTLSIDVIDTGPGMTAEHVAGLFTPFFQGDKALARHHGGSGLGLAISRRLAEMLGGDIRVHSVPQCGSTFTLVLPLQLPEGAQLLSPDVARARPRPRPSIEPPPADLLRGLRILLAEDGLDNQRLIAFVLRKAGAEVEVVGNGRQAVEACLATSSEDSASSQPFDVVLMDMQMPHMDGYEATRLLRAEGYGGPIIALTAHAMSHDRQRCLEAGCDDYLSKPVRRNDLLHLVARYARGPRRDAPPARVPTSWSI
jgi:PAS domain S-box-containing protein